MDEIIAIALVVEVSPTVLQKWLQVYQDYLAAIFMRISDAYQQRPALMATVYYGSSETSPTPIVCKRFFTNFKEARSHLTDLEVFNNVSSSDQEGLCTLDGLVACLELYDLLSAHYANNKPAIRHLIHISAAGPDATPHPMWNNSPALDDTDWGSLAQEIKKRNISFNQISLRAHPKQLLDLYTSVTEKTTSPWFTVHPQHNILLSALESPPPPRKTMQSIKRINEPSAPETVADNKRPRLQPTVDPPKHVATPSLVSAPTSTPVQPPPPNATPVPAPIQPPAPAPTSISGPIHGTTPSSAPSGGLPPIALTRAVAILLQLPVQIRERLSQFSLQQLHQNKASMEQQSANAEKNMERLIKEGSVAETEKFKPQREQLKQFILALTCAIAVRESGTPFPMGPPIPPAAASASPQAPLPFASVTSTPPSSTPNAQTTPRSAGGPNIPSGSKIIAPSMPTGMAPTGSPMLMQMQMQKLVEQNTQRLNQTTSGQPPNITNPLYPMAKVPSAGPQPNSMVVWKGEVSWTGHGSAGKKEIRMAVFAMTPFVKECHPETWPPVLTLVPHREPGLTSDDLQTWVQKLKPATCTLHPHITPGDPSHEHHFVALRDLLTQQGMYGTAAWTRPNGVQDKNMVLFAARDTLYAAVFPVTGIPELPKSSAMPQPNPDVTHLMQPNPMPTGAGPIPANLVASLPPELINKLKALPAEQQNAFMLTLVRNRHMHAMRNQQAGQQAITMQQAGQQAITMQQAMARMQANAQMQANGQNNNMVNSMQMPQGNNASGMNIGQGMVPPNMMGRMPNQNMPQGGPAANLSHDIFQSFLQRNPQQ